MQDDSASLRSCLARLCLDRIVRLEDFAAAETSALEDVLADLAWAMSDALERFDALLLAEKPKGWRVKDRRSRSILTEFGEVTFSRRIYIDEFGDRRSWLDEIVSLRAGKRLSPGAQHALSLFGAEVPYGRAAATLFRHCPEKVSAMTAMGALRETGDMLEEEAARRREDLFEKGLAPEGARQVSEIFVEADGVFVPLQRRKGSGIEIKALCAYAGKRGARRVGCVHHALAGDPKRFWEEGVAVIGKHYSLDTVKRCWAGTDGGAWCKALPGYLHGVEVLHKLDPWHVNRAIKRAYPEHEESAPLFELLHAGDVEGLIEVLRLRGDTGYGDAKKTRELVSYISSNKEAIKVAAPAMGTMEGTNAHLYAARMKAWGGAWSREGASDMARIRATIHSGEKLPLALREQDFSERDRQRRERLRDKLLYEYKYDMVRSDGRGYEPPRGHLMPFSTRQTYLAMFDPLN
ncbi:MAG: UPF0236 family transposase-like protein [Coriobacteriia bacterium]